MEFKMEDVLALSTAGFSKDDILKMSAVGTKDTGKKDPEKKEEPEKEDPEKKEEPEKKDPEKKEEPAGIEKLQGSIEELIKTIQASNLKGTNIGGDEKQVTAEDVLGGIINPYLEKEKK